MTQRKPVPRSYWVEPDRLLAGEYPGGVSEGETRERVRAFLDARVTFFLDLTEEDEFGLFPYQDVLAEEAARETRTVLHRRISIPDMSVPSPWRMAGILEMLSQALRQEHRVYVHCYAGIGRTGTVVGCYLVEQGLSGEEALDRLEAFLSSTHVIGRRSPETEAQRRMVLAWRARSARDR